MPELGHAFKLAATRQTHTLIEKQSERERLKEKGNAENKKGSKKREEELLLIVVTTG